MSQKGRWWRKGERRVRESTGGEGVAAGEVELLGVGAAASVGERVRARGHD